MRNKNKAMLAVFITLALTGCKDKKIEEVKNTKYEDIDKTNTLGNALDTRKICKEVKWESGQDDRKRDIVTYSCELTNFQPYFSQWNDKHIAAAVSSNQTTLENAKRDYENAKESKKLNENYFSFVERMDKQNVFAALAMAKKKTPAIHDMAKFADGQTEERAKEVGIPDETMPAFMVASRLYTSALDSKEFGQFFRPAFFNSTYSESFEEIINGINYGKTPASILERQKKDYYDADKDMATAREAAANASKAVSKDGIDAARKALEANQPAKIIQRVVYTVGNNTPQVLSCEFEFYTPNSKEGIAYRRKVVEQDTCLKASYQSEYNKYYTDMFYRVFVNQKDRK